MRAAMQLAKEGNVIEKPQDIVKQPTVLEFLGLEEKASYSESTLESALIDKLQLFLPDKKLLQKKLQEWIAEEEG